MDVLTHVASLTVSSRLGGVRTLPLYTLSDADAEPLKQASFLLFVNSDTITGTAYPLEQGGGSAVPMSRQRRFPRARSSVQAARSFALEALTDWGLFDRSEDVRLCVSELATNALLHGVPPGREFALTLAADGPLIRVEVRDSGGGMPELVDGRTEDEGGRGLRIVMALADDFGITPCPPGKTVWAVFKTDRWGEE